MEEDRYGEGDDDDGECVVDGEVGEVIEDSGVIEDTDGVV